MPVSKDGMTVAGLIYRFAENWPQENSEMRERYEEWKEVKQS